MSCTVAPLLLHRHDSACAATSEPRQHKTKTTRSRNGCIHCKRNKIKCSEDKPSCAACYKHSRECIYRPPKPWVFEPALSKDPSPPFPLPLSCGDLDLGFALPDMDLANDLVLPWSASGPSPPGCHAAASPPPGSTASSYTGSDQDGAPFAAIVADLGLSLTLAGPEPALDSLQHALAIVDRCQWGVPPPPDPQSTYFACINHAIDRQLSGLVDPYASIVCTWLLAVCEMARTGNIESTLDHLDHAVRSARALQASWELATPSSFLYPSQHSLDHVLGLDHTLRRMLVRVAYCRSLAACHPPLRVFGGFRDASMSLIDILSTMVVPLRRPLLADSEQDWFSPLDHARVAATLDNWMRAFDRMRSASAMEPIGSLSLMLALRLHYLVARLAVQCLPHGDDHFLLHAAGFSELVDLLEHFAAHARFQEAGEDLNLPLFTVPFFIATECRDLPIRTRALEYLSNMGAVADGPWNSRVAYLIASTKLGLELGPHSSLVRLESADCVLDHAARKAKLIVRYTATAPRSSSARDGARSPVLAKLTLLEDAGDYEACRSCTWPLESAMQSYGYVRSALAPIRCFPSPGIAAAMLEKGLF